MSAERREGGKPLAASDDTHEQLKSMLDTISGQLQDAERRHLAALDEMQHRISGMGREADAVRSRIPGQFATAFEQIESGIDELAHRLAAPTAERGRSGSRVSKGTRGADPYNPWDQETADALAGVYASSGYAVGGTTDGGSASRIDEAWLESRFAEIARGIEYSLAHVKPEPAVAELGQRFDHFERQFAKLFAGVATHDDLSTVRLIEAHMEEVVRHLEKTNDQLDRLNTLEAQLSGVSKALAEIQASSSGATGVDLNSVARAAAEETAKRFADQRADNQNAAAAELRPLIEQLMSENRQGGEQTAALLDTMQQAMVRLLDRVETIDFAQPAAPRAFESDPTDTYRREIHASDEGGLGHVRPFETANAAHEPAEHPGVIAPTSYSGSYDLGAGADEMAVRSEKLRQEFVADARRAKMRLAAEGDDIGATLPPPIGGSRPIRPSKQPVKNASGPTAPSPRLIVVALLALIALAGLWYVFGIDNKGEPPATHNSAQVTAPESKSEGSGSTPESGTASPGSSSNAPGASGEPGSAPAVNGPRGDLAPTGNDDHQAADDSASSGERTALPMLGVAVDLDRPMTEADLIQARRHQVMANLSGELGNAAARPGESAVVPASMVPSEAETEGTSPDGQSGDAVKASAKPAQLDMPTAMIGPLSLRLAAANGDPSAEFEVGARFAEGEGVKQNFIEAAKWYQRSADQGFAQAEYRLGTLYERGLGLKPDRGQAATWYLRAAQQGNIKSMHNLAVLSANQTDRSPDYTTAARWFEEAAKRGLPDSQFNLAVLYENGLGVVPDRKKAFMWISLAAQAGDADAIRRRDILRGRLTAQELAQAQKMIDTWQITPSERTINDALAAGELWKRNPKNGING